MIERIDLLLASRCNHFMVEIAELYQEGFRRLGTPCRIAFDEYPNQENAQTVYPLIVAPHEYFELYADEAYGGSRRREIASRAGVLNTEQPGSPWFDSTWAAARHARHVFDINRSGIVGLGKLGVPAIYAPIGYAPTMDDVGGPHDGAKPIDIVFLGCAAPKRDKFFARYRDFFQKYECRLIFVPANQLRSLGVPNCVFGSDRNRLLRSAKLLINVHSSDRRYFEWHRALCAMANRCLLVTETSDGAAPLVPDVHMVMTDADRLAEACDHYLRDPAARAQIVERAHRLLGNELSIEGSCRSILNAARSGAAVRRSWTIATKAAALGAQTRRLCRTTAWHLRQKRADILLDLVRFWPRHMYWQWFGGRTRAARRDAIVKRLGALEQAGAAPQSYYLVVDNPAYPKVAHPAISVVVTLYNYAQYVRSCLESAAQSETTALPGGIELVVVDDASTDGGSDVVADFMKSCAVPVRLVRKSTNTGLTDARNTGLREARADYIFILDADNLVYPRGLEQLYRTIRSGELAAAFGVIACFDDKTGDGVGLHSAFAWDVRRLVRGAYIDAMALLDRKKVLAVGGYSTELVRYGWGWEDYDLWLKLATAGQECRLCPQIVAAYRVHGASMIRITNGDFLNFVRYFKRKFAPLVERVDPTDRAFGWWRVARYARRRGAAPVEGGASASGVSCSDVTGK